MPPSEIPVLIVGGGPTGLTMALCLAKYGIDVRVVEEATSPHKAIRGTAIAPRTLELLDILGVTDQIQGVSVPPLQMAVYDPSGMNIAKAFDWSQPADISPTIPFRSVATVGQAMLEDVLRRQLAALGCPMEYGKKLIGIRQDAHNVSALVELSDGRTETVKCAFLVAADGAKGHSRRLLGIPFIGETKEADRLLTANVNIPGFNRDYWHRWGDFAKSAVFLKPVHPAPLFQLQALGPAMPHELPEDVSTLQRFFNTVSARQDVVFADASCITEWKANIRMTEKLSSGKVFLAGDAAHCHSPAGGQGTNTAMQDSFNLAWKLALVLKNVADISLLSTYETERLPVIAEMLGLSSALHCARKTPYGAGATTSIVRAGDRAPFFDGVQDSAGQATNIFRLLGECGCAHLVPRNYGKGLIGGVIVFVRTALDSESHSSGAKVVVDSDGAARRAYNAEEKVSVWVAIRPDGIVGAYAYTVENVVTYLERLKKPLA
ncbi:FAD binding domain-containing protein [Mycena latifolia]|nr:FAD binding domain-containing protein [Mycena latifolia]